MSERTCTICGQPVESEIRFSGLYGGEGWPPEICDRHLAGTDDERCDEIVVYWPEEEAIDERCVLRADHDGDHRFTERGETFS